MATTKLHAKFLAARDALNGSLIERDAEVDLAMVSLVAGEHMLLVGPPGCLAGDTTIQVNRGGNSQKIRMDRLVKMLNGGHRNGDRSNRGIRKDRGRYQVQVWENGSHKHIGCFGDIDEARAARDSAVATIRNPRSHWDAEIPTYVSRNVNGIAKLGRIKSAWSSGVQTTYTIVTESGKSIRATANHPFETPTGEWRRLDELKPGDEIMTTGKRPAKPKERYRVRQTKYHPHQRVAKNGFRYWEHRLAYEAKMNGMGLEDYLAILRKDEAASSRLQFLDRETHVHHKDGNHLNNDPSNLEALSSAEHHAAHDKVKNALAHVVPDRIVSIEEYGKEETFDMEIEDDPHSFLANGFSVHNCGKSLLVDSLLEFVDGPTFSILMTKFTTPEDVMGPLSLPELKAGNYRRVTKGRLPEAAIGFADEFWKTSSAAANCMLRMLNEGVYEQEGRWVKAPLRSFYAGSNEWPDSENGGQELGAIFDRFAIRYEVKPIRTQSGRDRLLFGDLPPVAYKEKVTPEEIDTAQAEARALPFGDDAKDAMVRILDELAKEEIRPSDRRKRKATTIARAAAWLADSDRVKPEHLDVLQFVLWDDPKEQPKKAAKVVGAIANPSGSRITELVGNAEAIAASVDVKDLAKASVAVQKLREIDKQLERIGDHPRVKGARNYVREQSRRISNVVVMNDI